MADSTDSKIILEEHECQEGHCPVCDGDSIDYHSYEVTDNIVAYPWSCSTCGAEGQEIGEIRFIGHDLHRDTIPEQVDSLYVDGGLRPESENIDQRGEVDLDKFKFPMKLEPGRFYLLKVKDGHEFRHVRGINFDYYDMTGRECDAVDYHVVHSGILGSVRSPEEYYEQLYIKLSGKNVDGYGGEPMGMSDILIITPGDVAHAFFCDEMGDYRRIDNFLRSVASNTIMPEDGTVHVHQSEDDRVRSRPIEDSPLSIYFSGKGLDEGTGSGGEWIGLPTTPAVLGEAFDRLHISDTLRHTWMASALDSNSSHIGWEAMSEVIPQVSVRNIDEVNYFAALVEKLSPEDCAKLEALIEIGIANDDLGNTINLVHNLHTYEFLPEIRSPLKYAQYLAGDDSTRVQPIMDMLDNPTSTKAKVVAGGQFTSKGYVRYPLKRWEYVYDGRNVPEQYRVCSEVDMQKQKPKQSKKRDNGAR
ncbi:hypothetical protein LJC64_01135 [Ruminococcaceae bacterium OttesenSCG-928-A11]|nr:hypothetical protein [Ruminococcaceae bacterium OttesenSCG-928-A11]